MKNLTDNEVIESIKKGNSSDYSIIVDRYKNKAFSLLKKMLKNEMEAEEVLQDCFMKAFKGLNSFKFESKFSTWFYRIVYNTALSKLSVKKRKIESEMLSIDESLELKSGLDFYTTEKKDISSFIKEIISKLPENFSTVITLFYLNEMSCEEISDVMNTSVSNVKVMLHRSRSSLKDLLIKNNYAEELL